MRVNISVGNQFKSVFLNDRMPTIADNDPAETGPPVSVFEFGTILLYLAEKTGKFLPTDLRGSVEALQWLGGAQGDRLRVVQSR